MRIPIRHRLSLENESMTPMIDVVFLLLVFFVCASVGLTPDSLLPAQLADGNTETKVELPPENPDEFPSQEVRIKLSKDTAGHLAIQLNERSVTNATELRDRLQKLATLDSDSRILLNIADNVSVQQFIAIYDRCQALGFTSISFALPRPGHPGG